MQQGDLISLLLFFFQNKEDRLKAHISFPFLCCAIFSCLLLKATHRLNLQCIRASQARSHAIAQAVSRWLPTAAAQVQARVWKVGFVVDKVALGQVFSEYFGFPCQSSFHQILHHKHPGQVQ
jgi:hypothetical protein